MSKVMAAILAVCAAVLLGYGIFTHMNSGTGYVSSSILGPSAENGNIGDHVKGSVDAPVVIVEYADFQCPSCAFINGLVNAAVEQLDGKVAFVYRNFLLSYHQNGTAAASAAESAGLQGYWKEYADLLFENQEEWEYSSPSERTTYFKKYFLTASNGEGDMDAFLSNLSSEDISRKISNDMKLAKAVNIQGTPSLYIDDQLIDWSTSGRLSVNGKTITWDSGRLDEDSFIKLIKDIAEASIGE